MSLNTTTTDNGNGPTDADYLLDDASYRRGFVAGFDLALRLAERHPLRSIRRWAADQLAAWRRGAGTPGERPPRFDVF